MEKLKQRGVEWLRWSEKYTKTDMVYLVKNSFWMNANTVITSIFAFVLSIVFARFVAKETYGTYQFLLSVSSTLGALTLIGMNAAVTQAVARGFDGTFRHSIKTQIKFGLIPFFVGIIASLYYLISGNQTLSISILIVAFLLPFINSLNTWEAFLAGKKDYKNTFFFSQIINLIYYAGIILCIFVFPNALVLILLNFSLLTISNLLVYFLVLKKYKPNEKSEDEAISYGKKLSLSNLLTTVALNIDNILIFHFLGAAPLAIYAFASNIPERLGSLLRPIAVIAFPKFAEKSQEEVRKVLPQKTKQLFFLAFVGGIIYFFSAPYIFGFFFPQYLSAVLYSQIYAIATVIAIVGGLPLTSLIATRSNKIYYYNTISPIFNIVMLSLLAYLFGIWGVIFGKIIGNGFSLTLSYWLQKE